MLAVMPHVLNIASRLWSWLFTPTPSKTRQQSDQRLEELRILVGMAASVANLHAYATSVSLREAMVQQWSEFRAKADELSRPYPVLRPKLGRLYLALEDLAVRDACRPRPTARFCSPKRTFVILLTVTYRRWQTRFSR